MADLREALAAQLEAEIRPLLSGEYDCCGCSTYDAILDHAIRIVRGVKLCEGSGTMGTKVDPRNDPALVGRPNYARCTVCGGAFYAGFDGILVKHNPDG